MSRVEEITEKLIQMMTAESEWVKTGIELEEVHNGIRRVAEGVATHVERLLAQERELMECKHPKSCWVDEGDCLIRVDEGSPPLYSPSMRRPRKYCSTCAERERVREMCVAAACPACKEGLPLEKDSNGNEFHVAQVGEDDYEQAHCYSEAIRQLDLTKDLAASNRKESETKR